MRTDTVENNKTLPHITKADKTLQMKVGSGPLDTERIKKCQDVIDDFDGDFPAEAEKFLKDLSEALSNLKSSQDYTAEALEALAVPVMQLKANGSTFGYTLISNLANIVLNFLESIANIDKDVVSIIEAHYSSLR